MNNALLKKHIDRYLGWLSANPEQSKSAKAERQGQLKYYQSWSATRLAEMTASDLFEYLSKLWAMLSWGNKHYVVDKLIEENGLDRVGAELIWAPKPIESRWDRFRRQIKRMGPEPRERAA
jgi:hypothetical protein